MAAEYRTRLEYLKNRSLTARIECCSATPWDAQANAQARLGDSGPEKKVLRARRTRGPKMAKIQKIQKSNRHDQNVGKVEYSGKTRLKIQNHPIFVQNHKDSIFL